MHFSSNLYNRLHPLTSWFDLYHNVLLSAIVLLFAFWLVWLSFGYSLNDTNL